MTDLVEELACQELVERVTEYLDSALPNTDRAQFEEHILECPACAEVLGQFRAVIAMTGRLATTDVATIDPATRDELLELFRAVQHGTA